MAKNPVKDNTSRELTEAKESISTDDIKLTPQQEQEIAEIAADQEEADELIEDLKIEKAKELALQAAKNKVDKEVPTKHVIERPSYGPITAQAEFHMRNSFKFLLGRKVKDKPRIIGLFSAGAKTKVIYQAYLAGCPFAALYLCRIEDEIEVNKSIVKITAKEIDAYCDSHMTLKMDPFTANRPTAVSFNLFAKHGYHFVEILLGYDQAMRTLMPYQQAEFMPYKEYIQYDIKMSRGIRRLFKLTNDYSFVGKEHVEAKDAVYMAAVNHMGEVPDDILSGERKPKFVRENEHDDN